MKKRLNVLASAEKLVKNIMLDEGENILREMNYLFMYDGDIKNYMEVVLLLKGQLDSALINLALSNTLKQNSFNTMYNLACVL